MTISLKQFGLLPKRFYQGRTPPHPAKCLAGRPGQVKEIFGTEVGQFVLLAVPPNVFHGIEFRSVGRQVIHMDAPPLPSDKIAHRSTAMRRQTIPQNQQLGGDMSLEVLQELDYLWSLDTGNNRK